MIRLIVLGLLTLGVLALPGLGADEKPEPGEGPIRLKKKSGARPDADKPMKPADQPPDAPRPAAGEEDDREALARLQRNLRSSEERLAQKDASDATQAIQKEIVKDLDALIERTRRQQQNQQPSGSGSSSSQNPRAGQNQPEGSGQQNGAGQPNGTSPQPVPRPMEMGGRGGDGRAQQSRPPDPFKDVWGHLPEALRLELDAYSREKFMARYRDLLEQYYATIAEKGRRAGD